MKNLVLLVLIIFVFAIDASAQKAYGLEFSFVNFNKEFKIPKYKDKFKDTIARNDEIVRVINEVQSNGFVEVIIEKSSKKNKVLAIDLNIGDRCKWSSLNFNSTQWKMLKDLKVESVDFNNKDFNYYELIALQEDIIKRFENSGYPFAYTKLDNIIIRNKQIYADLIIEKGQLIKIDTIELFGFRKISIGFIQQYLGIKIGEAYNESMFAEIDNLIKRLDFIQMDKPFVVKFKDKSAILQLYLKEKRNNQFNGIIGFQQDDGSENMLVTGNLNLKLVNSLGRGERIDILWESPGNQSQFLEVGLQYPYLFNTAFGVGLDFKIDKRDTTYVNLEYKPAVHFAFGGQDYLSVYGHIFESNYLQTDIEGSVNLNMSDVSSQTFGVGLFINRLDNVYNPRRGYKVSVNADGGKKQFSLLVDEELDDKDELLFRGASNIQYYIPLFKRQTLKLANSNALIQSENLRVNELYKIGGFKTLRGFDEQSLFASFYNISTIEYRLLFEQYSYIGAFYDIAQVVNADEITETGVYQSFGLSFNFSTKAGVFGLSYAIGKNESSEFKFDEAKIHFGYMAVF